MSATASPAKPPSVTPAATPHVAAILTLLAFVAIVLALYFARAVLVPVTLAVLLSFLLAPLVGGLRRIHLPRAVAVLVSVAASLGIILALGGLLGVQIADLARGLPRYQSTILDKLHLVQGYTTGRLVELTRQFEPEAAQPAPSRPAGSPAAPNPVPVEVQPPPQSPVMLAQRVLEPVLGPLETTCIVFIVAIFVLMQQEDLRDRLIRLFGSTDLHRTTMALDDAGRRLSRYFLTQLAINASFGGVLFAGLMVIGVPNAALWAILSGLLRFVPYIGTWIAGLLPTLLAAAVAPGWGLAAETFALYAVVELLTGQVIEPVLYGHSTGLSPISVVVAAIFWSWLWGPIGLILSTPLTLCLVVLGRHVPRLEFLDVILGDRPALTPVETFYQRVLAGDADEALDQAETLLKDRPLSSYYDEVAVMGARLAVADIARGALPPEKSEWVRAAMLELIGDLAGHDDRPPGRAAVLPSAVAPSERDTDPPVRPVAGPDLERSEARPPWSDGTPVLCIAGRGPLDDVPAAMLAQLLGKHGIGATTAPHTVVGRRDVATLDSSGIAMVCLCYLEIGAATSHLRYALRRLRQQLPGVPILVGLWPVGEAVLHDERLRDAVGADHTAGSLTDAVNVCLRQAAAQRELITA